MKVSPTFKAMATDWNNRKKDYPFYDRQYRRKATETFFASEKIYKMMQTTKFIKAMSKLLGTPINKFSKIRHPHLASGNFTSTAVYLAPHQSRHKVLRGCKIFGQWYSNNGVMVDVCSPCLRLENPLTEIYIHVFFVRKGTNVWNYAKKTSHRQPYLSEIKNVDDLIQHITDEYERFCKN